MNTGGKLRLLSRMARTVDALVVDTHDPEANELAAVAAIGLLHLADRLRELEEDREEDGEKEAVVAR